MAAQRAILLTVGFALLVRFAVSALCAAEGETPVIDFIRNYDLTKMTGWGIRTAIKTRKTGTWLTVHSGHDKPWPGATMKAPGGSGDKDGQNPNDATVWDLSANTYIAFPVKNLSDTPITVNCRVDNKGADGTRFCNNGSVDIAPGETKQLRVDFARARHGTLDLNLFGMRGYPPQMVAAKSGQGIDPAKINQILVFLDHPTRDYTFEVGPIVAGGCYTAPPPVKDDLTVETFFPFIDTFGQFIHADWPGKTHSLAELKSRVTEEKKDWAAHPAPTSFNKWGGWNDGPQKVAGGFFRVEKIDGMWWLIDPDGKLFFSNGIDCITPWQETPIDERKNWFQNFPGDLPENKDLIKPAWHVVNGHYQGKKPQTFNFVVANLRRKFDADWENAFIANAHARLHSWGLNTIGAWSYDKVYLARKTPYTVILHFGGKALEGSEGYWGQFRDVYDPSFAAELEKRVLQEKDKSAGDPWCLGYFIDNELAWGNDTSLAVATLKSPVTQAAKTVLLQVLQTKYGTIEKLNAAWNTQYPSWDGWLESQQAPDKKVWTDGFRQDMGAFYSQFAEKYFQLCRDTLKKTAPQQLYLGCRFAWVNDRAAQAAAKYCDVVSFNLYRRSIAEFKTNVGDLPLIVGEFHFGALDRGKFHTGLVPVASQAERAAAYKSYVTGALRHPQFVGIHWFQYQDEPTTGRSLDEENYQIGFVDEVDTPYSETVAAAREIAATLYAVRAGKQE